MDLMRVTWRRFERLAMVWRVRVVLTVGLVAANVVGAVIVYFLCTRVVPVPAIGGDPDVQRRNLELALGYVVVAGLVASFQSWRDLDPLVRLLREDGEATDKQRRRVLGAPLLLFVRQLVWWSIGALTFGAFNFRYDAELGVTIGLIVGLAGWSVCSIVYLVAERRFDRWRVGCWPQAGRGGWAYAGWRCGRCSRGPWAPGSR